MVRVNADRDHVLTHAFGSVLDFMPRHGHLRALGVCILLLGASFLLAGGCGVKETDASPVRDRIDGMFQAERDFAYEGIRQIESGQEGARTDSWSLVTHRPGRPCRVDALGRGGGRARPRWIHGPRLYWLADTELLLRNYRVREEGRDVVAGRRGTVLEVESYHPGRPSLRLVVDDETGLLLATERRDFRGEVVFRSSFHTLIITPVEGGAGPGEGGTAERFFPGFPSRFGSGGGRETSDGNRPFRTLIPRFLPAGFEKKRDCFFRGRYVLLLTDGLAWIRITQSLAEEGAPERVARRWWRGDRAMMRMVYEGVAVRIVGRLDAEVLQRILESLAPAAPGESADSE